MSDVEVEVKLPERVSVNVWSLMTTLEGRDLPNSDQCAEFIALTSKAGGFGNECSVSVNQNGTWTFRVFSCDDSADEVSLRVTKSGHVSVTRTTGGEIRDERTVSF